MPITDSERQRLRLLLLSGMRAYEARLDDDSDVFNPDDDVFLDGIIDAWCERIRELISSTTN